MVNWKKIGCVLGLTKRKEYGLSDIICEDAVVTSKMTNTSARTKDETAKNWSAADLNPALSYSSPDFYWVTFRSEKVLITRDRKGLFENFEEGDEVNLCYRKIFKSVYDYAPPDFREKKLIKKTFSGYRLESVEKK